MKAWLAAAAVLSVAPGAGAQTIATDKLAAPLSSAADSIGPAQPDITVRSQGRLVVSFHGDAAAGCASIGVCGYSGTVVWRAAGEGDLLIVTHRHRPPDAELLMLPNPHSRPMTSATVKRPGPGEALATCTDAPSDVLLPAFGNELDLKSHSGRATFLLVDSSTTALLTRCAGPLDSDLAGAAPSVTVPIRDLRRRRMIDLSGTRSFAGHGFAGTVSSTVTLRLGRLRGNGGGGGGFPPGIRIHRMRFVFEKLGVRGVAGSVSAAFHGSSGPAACAHVDSCGATGTIAWSLAPFAVHAGLYAVGPATAPLRDFLAALHGAHRRGIQVGGEVGWQDHAVGLETFRQSGVCSDTTPLSGGVVSFFASRRGLDARYVVDSALRSRCPGPIVTRPAASGSIPLSALARRTFTIRLHGPTLFTDRGYAGRFQGRLSLTLRRGRVTQQVEAVPS